MRALVAWLFIAIVLIIATGCAAPQEDDPIVAAAMAYSERVLEDEFDCEAEWIFQRYLDGTAFAGAISLCSETSAGVYWTERGVLFEVAAP